VTFLSEAPPDVRAQIAVLRERLLRVNYYAEASWLTAAVEYPSLCDAAEAQEALRGAATIAWQFGFAGVSNWIRREMLTDVTIETSGENTRSPHVLVPRFGEI
jgi:hypothetical protein